MSWQFQFKKNVHMYCHGLKCKKGNVEFDCQSEDSAKEDKVILFWLDDLPLQEAQLTEFSADLENWAKNQKFKFRIYYDNECLAAHV